MRPHTGRHAPPETSPPRRPAPACSDRRRRARPTRWAFSKPLPTYAWPAVRARNPTLSPSSPAPRPGPSTPQRWPAAPTSSTGPCAASHGCGATSMHSRSTAPTPQRGTQRRTLAHAAVPGLGTGEMAPHAPALAAGQRPAGQAADQDGAAGAPAPADPPGPPAGAGRHGVELQLGRPCHVFEAGERLDPWIRSQRRAVRDRITHEHLLASAAIPLFSRQQPSTWTSAPSTLAMVPCASPRPSRRPSTWVPSAFWWWARAACTSPRPRAPRADQRLPSLAQIAGHALSNIFLDALSVDVERMQRINQTISLIPPGHAATARCGPSICW